MCHRNCVHLLSWRLPWPVSFLSVMLLAILSTLGCGDQPGTSRLMSLTVTPGSVAIALGQSTQLKVIGKYSDGTSQEMTSSVIWQNLDSNIATISQSGLVSSVAVGQTEVTATKSGVSVTVPLIVSKAALEALSINPSSATIALGASTQLVATGTYTDKTTQDLTQLVKWEADQPGIVTVNASGVAVSKSVGNSAVSASLDGISGSNQITVLAAALVAIIVRSQNASVPLGSKEQFTAIGAYTDGTTVDLTNTVSWTSQPTGILPINGTGLATAKAVGSVAVSATSRGISGVGNITVSPAALVSIDVGTPQALFTLGAAQQLTATGTYTDGLTRNLSGTVQWLSASPDIVSIGEAGLATAKAVGTTIVSASSGNISGMKDLTVSNAALVSIKVILNQPSFPIGSTQQINATGSYTDNSSQDLTGSVHWVSSSPQVVSISNTGLATAKSTGNAVVSASTDKISGTGNLSVSAAELASISISPANPTIPLGGSQQLAANGLYTDGSSKDLSNIVHWGSLSPDVATISRTGMVTANAVGMAGIAASSGKITAETDVGVSTAALVSIAISPANPTVPLGSTQQLSATGNYTDGSTQDVTSQIFWTIDDSTVASVDAAGVATGQQVGVTEIDASLSGLHASGTLTVQPLLSVGYFDGTSGIDTAIRATNPATTGQNICGMIYVFDQDQQMSECCGCLISRNGLLTLSLQHDLLSNPLTGVQSKSGTILLVPADYASNSSCNASSITPSGTAVAWSTHIQKASTGQLATLEDAFSSSPLSTTLSAALQAQCSFIQQLGGGQGQCTCGNPQ